MASVQTFNIQPPVLEDVPTTKSFLDQLSHDVILKENNTASSAVFNNHVIDSLNNEGRDSGLMFAEYLFRSDRFN